MSDSTYNVTNAIFDGLNKALEYKINRRLTKREEEEEYQRKQRRKREEEAERLELAKQYGGSYLDTLSGEDREYNSPFVNANIWGQQYHQKPVPKAVTTTKDKAPTENKRLREAREMISLLPKEQQANALQSFLNKQLGIVPQSVDTSKAPTAGTGTGDRNIKDPVPRVFYERNEQRFYDAQQKYHKILEDIKVIEDKMKELKKSGKDKYRTWTGAKQSTGLVDDIMAKFGYGDNAGEMTPEYAELQQKYDELYPILEAAERELARANKDLANSQNIYNSQIYGTYNGNIAMPEAVSANERALQNGHPTLQGAPMPAQQLQLPQVTLTNPNTGTPMPASVIPISPNVSIPVVNNPVISEQEKGLLDRFEHIFNVKNRAKKSKGASK